MDWSTKNQSPQWLSRNGWYINYPESEVWVYHKFKSWKNSHGCQLMSNTPIIDPAWQIRVAPGLHKRGQHILGTIRAASQPQKLRICHNVEGFDFRGGQSPRGDPGLASGNKALSETNFLDLFLDVESRENFVRFLSPWVMNCRAWIHCDPYVVLLSSHIIPLSPSLSYLIYLIYIFLLCSSSDLVVLDRSQVSPMSFSPEMGHSAEHWNWSGWIWWFSSNFSCWTANRSADS